MFDSIDSVKRQYTYAVQPVKLFETKNKRTESNNPFANFTPNSSLQKYNLYHPNVSNSSSGGKLDFLS
ncbi:MAG: hypothetical protein NC191_00160 [Muribaculaceae bacterium]|nr:hypothetical protein [Muribaculaceae bacterium]